MVFVTRRLGLSISESVKKVPLTEAIMYSLHHRKWSISAVFCPAEEGQIALFQILLSIKFCVSTKNIDCNNTIDAYHMTIQFNMKYNLAYFSVLA